MGTAKYEYDRKFFDYLDHSAQRSAHIIVGHLLGTLRPRSVLDVGCGRGVWCTEWRTQGVDDVIGIDGDYVDLDNLVMPCELFIAHDLTRRLDLGRRFDLVTCLEVANTCRPRAPTFFSIR
jgi:2-polyprenyl-3-methyl-5-hydroxy-6-metoxy-1,4-benzoquinol methylase